MVEVSSSRVFNRIVRRTVKVTVATLLLAPGMASAQLAECNGLGGTSDAYKVVMDQLVLPADLATTAPKLRDLRDRLAFALSMQLSEFLSDVQSKKIEPAIGLSLIDCVNRKPSPGGAEFDKQRVMTLNNQRVVVELWGHLLLSDDSRPTEPHALIGYVIPPVMHYLPNPAVLGRFTVKYPKQGTDAAAALQKLPEASAFAMVGLGLKASKANKYDLATWAFGRSEASIKQAQDFGGAAELGALLVYVKRAACETRERARDDAAYDGPLSLTLRERCGAPT